MEQLHLHLSHNGFKINVMMQKASLFASLPKNVTRMIVVRQFYPLDIENNKGCPTPTNSPNFHTTHCRCRETPCPPRSVRGREP